MMQGCLAESKPFSGASRPQLDNLRSKTQRHKSCQHLFGMHHSNRGDYTKISYGKVVVLWAETLNQVRIWLGKNILSLKMTCGVEIWSQNDGYMFHFFVTVKWGIWWLCMDYGAKKAHIFYGLSIFISLMMMAGVIQNDQNSILVRIQLLIAIFIIQIW